MVVCHQPYSEILQMDFGLSIRLFQAGGQLLQSFLAPSGMPMKQSTNGVIPDPDQPRPPSRSPL